MESDNQTINEKIVQKTMEMQAAARAAGTLEGIVEFVTAIKEAGLLTEALLGVATALTRKYRSIVLPEAPDADKEASEPAIGA